MICYGGGSVINSGLLKKITDALIKEKINFVEFSGISANPLKNHALKGIDFAKKNKVDFVLAIGGGSVIDTAKCIAAGAVNNNVWKFYQTEDDAVDLERALSLGVVLTIPAAGSEGSSGSVIRDEKTGIKYAIMAECLRPKFAFINPEYCFTLPKEQIANGASDILAHLLERYFSPQDNIMVTDKLLTAAMQAIIEISPKVYNDNTNYNYWSEFCLLGTLAHNGMLDMGRNIQDWASHIIKIIFYQVRITLHMGLGFQLYFQLG